MGILSTPARRATALVALVAGLVAAAHRSAGSVAAGTAPRAAALVAAACFTGCTFYTTFIIGIVLFKKFGGTPTFGDVQAVLFPAYFATQSVCAAIALGITAAGLAGGGPATPRVVTAAIALVTSLANYAVVEPLTTAAMYARRAADADPSADATFKAAARKKFGAFHGVSSLLNLVGLGGGVAYLWLVAESL